MPEAHRVKEADQLLDAALLAQLGVAHSKLHASIGKFLAGCFELHTPFGLPPEIGQSINFARMKGQTVAAIVHTEIQPIRIAFRILTYRKAHYRRTIVAPGIKVSGFKAYATQSNNIHLFLLVLPGAGAGYMARSPPSMTISDPVMNDASSDATSTAIETTSSGSPEIGSAHV